MAEYLIAKEVVVSDEQKEVLHHSFNVRVGNLISCREAHQGTEY
jgi:hypothetical protein